MRRPTLGLLGSGEFLPWAGAVDLALLNGAPPGSGRVLVLPTASAPEGEQVFARWAAMGLAHYRALGVAAELLAVRTRADADDPRNVARVAGASLVFCSGGNPAYLSATLSGSALWGAVVERLDDGLAYGGCSAGVQCLGEWALDATVGAVGPERWRRGLRLFPGVWFGPHWDAMDRHVPGLKTFVRDSVPAGDVLIGVDEETAMVGDGDEWDVVGTGGVHVGRDGSWSHHPAGTRFAHSLRRDVDIPADAPSAER